MPEIPWHQGVKLVETDIYLSYLSVPSTNAARPVPIRSHWYRPGK